MFKDAMNQIEKHGLDSRSLLKLGSMKNLRSLTTVGNEVSKFPAEVSAKHEESNWGHDKKSGPMASWWFWIGVTAGLPFIMLLISYWVLYQPAFWQTLATGLVFLRGADSEMVSM
jgi:hypothetical protein